MCYSHFKRPAEIFGLDEEHGYSEYPTGAYKQIDQYFHLRPHIFIEFSTQRRQPERLKPQPEVIEKILPVVEEEAADEPVDRQTDKGHWR